MRSRSASENRALLTIVQADESWRRLRSGRSGVLGTVDLERGTHLVPVVYTPLDDASVVIAVDAKPKRTRRLHRLSNIDADPRVTLLVDSYSGDWSRLWWVRVDGLASVSPSVPDDVEQRHRLRYPQLDGHALGPWIEIRVERISGWAAT